MTAWGSELLAGADPLSSEMIGIAHPEEVFEWRQQEFRRMKFPAVTADWLARTRVDLTQMEDLLKSGCERHLAIKILEGTSWAGEDDQPYPRASEDGKDARNDSD